MWPWLRNYFNRTKGSDATIDPIWDFFLFVRQARAKCGRGPTAIIVSKCQAKQPSWCHWPESYMYYRVSAKGSIKWRLTHTLSPNTLYLLEFFISNSTWHILSPEHFISGIFYLQHTLSPEFFISNPLYLRNFLSPTHFISK